jgi:DNA-binding NarL/FixJ family response regulator/anti-sigma regulatory factor (Ser/Thr protein kinase)
MREHPHIFLVSRSARTVTRRLRAESQGVTVAVMEWAADGRSPAAVAALRREIAAYLARHAEPDSDLAGAEMVIAELLSNAFEHAPGPAWVRASWEREKPRLEVHDLGPGFVLDPRLPEPDSERGRGLFIVDSIADDLARSGKRAGGSVVSAALPVRRRVERFRDGPRDTVSPLPPMEEAGPDGTFGKEAFLRALVVELAQTIEADQGPDVAAATVAQVGADIGGRMEQAYRVATGIAGRLSPEQMADLYVRLKGAIGGDFYVIQADERKIVLGNRRCPFGDVVQREPALCHMTSSVFGGIAARNASRSAVDLQERIALGDPECRIVIWLGDGCPADASPTYRSTGSRQARAVDRDLVEACRAAMHGDPYLYPAAIAAYMREFLRHGEYLGGAPKDPLTRREREIVTMIAESHTGREIAEKLVISEKTVERHRANILIKLGLRDRVALTRYAIRRGLIEA